MQCQYKPHPPTTLCTVRMSVYTAFNPSTPHPQMQLLKAVENYTSENAQRRELEREKRAKLHEMTEWDRFSQASLKDKEEVSKLQVRMCVCTYVEVVHGNTHTRTHARTHAHMHARMHACTHAHTHTHMHTYTDMHIYLVVYCLLWSAIYIKYLPFDCRNIWIKRSNQGKKLKKRISHSSKL